MKWLDNIKHAMRLKESALIRGENKEILGVSKNLDKYLGVFDDSVMPYNMLTLFETLAEVYFPVSSIAVRVSRGNYLLKDYKTDAVIWDNVHINKFLSRPNPIFTFQELIQQIVQSRLLTGRALLHADCGFETLAAHRWKYADNYSLLPSDNTDIVLQQNTNPFTASSVNEIIEKYRFRCNADVLDIAPYNVLNIKDCSMEFGSEYITGKPRLWAAKYPVCNLIASYEARNAIFMKRGALGALISKKTDASGAVPLTKSEKDTIIADYQRTYGVTSGKTTIMLTEIPVEFIRFSMSIQELQPYDEHLEDALQIAGVFHYPPDLIPRRDKSTYANQESSELGLYTNVIVPMAKEITTALTNFLGLHNDGMYLDVDYSDIPVFQFKEKEKAETKKIIAETCRMNFLSGIITLNEWAAQIGGEKKNTPINNKTLFEMTTQERILINEIIGKNNSVKNNENNQVL
jgi:hypothetical protein